MANAPASPMDERQKFLEALQSILPRFEKDSSRLGLHEISLLLGTTREAVDQQLLKEPMLQD